MKSIEQQIHDDVYSAQDSLLKEAEEILSKPSQYDGDAETRLNKLAELGFGRAEEVVKYKAEKASRESHAESKKLIDTYKQKYPLYRFITEEAVKVICDKYQLLLANAGDYIAEIPVKNQNEIINFSFFESDFRSPISAWGMMDIVMPSFDFDPITGRMRSYYEPKKEKKKDPNKKISGKNLSIVAPAHKLNIEGREIEGHVLKIKDPIVLQPVIGGYLIVTSWGLEASDPEVVNPIQN